jgi:hypothetical protein
VSGSGEEVGRGVGGGTREDLSFFILCWILVLTGKGQSTSLFYTENVHKLVKNKKIYCPGLLRIGPFVHDNLGKYLWARTRRSP